MPRYSVIAADTLRDIVTLTFDLLTLVSGFYKTRHILLSNGANCTVLRAVVLTQYRRATDRQTDRRTDGIAVANTALAMRALRAL